MSLETAPLGPRRAEGRSGPVPLSGRLEKILGRPRSEWTAEDLAGFVRTQGIRIVSLMHVGGDGCLKTLDFAPRGEAHLRDVLEGGERADGSSLFPGTGIRPGASDVLLRPRFPSAFLDPFSDESTLALLCSHAGRDGRPLPESPDTIVRAAHERVRAELGIELQALGEVEYFLGRRAGDLDLPGADDRGYHASAPFVFGESLGRTALAVLADVGVPIKYAHSEVGHISASERDDSVWEQHEIELALAPLPDAADGVALTHWVLRNLAHRSGMRVSFDPIVRSGHAGSGLHFHLSPVRDGRHLGVRDRAGRLSEPARWLIAGLVQHGGALMAFGNRAEGSFQRLAQGREAPTSVTWGECDRRALVRLPVVAQAPDGRPVSASTIEFRLPDGSAHPHLLLAGVAQAMTAARECRHLDGLLAQAAVVRSEERPADARALPGTRREIFEALSGSRAAFEAGGVFPREYVSRVLEFLAGCAEVPAG